MAAHTYKSYLSSFDDPDVIEVSPAASGWVSGSHHKRERSKVVIESDDEPEGVMINGDEISVEKNKKADVHPIDWPNHSKSSLLHDIAGSSSHTFTKKVSWSGTFTKSNPCPGSTFTKAKPWPGTIKKNPDPWFGHKLEHEESASSYLDGWPYEGYEHDYAYDEDKYEDDGYDALLFESEYNYSLTTKFDGLGAPSAEASLPWPQKTSVENASKAKPTKIMNEKTDEKYEAFKQFDDLDVIEVSPAARGWASGHQKRKRSKVVIESDDDEEPEWVMINGDKTSVEKNKKAVVHPIDWPKHSESSLLHDAAGSRSRTFTKKVPWSGTFTKSNPWPGTFIKSNPWPDTFTKSNPWPDTFFKKPAPWFGHKLEHEESASNYSDGWPYEGYEDDYAYDEDDVYDALPFESEYNSSLATEFDGVGAPGAEASLPWLQKTSIENAIKAKPTKIMNEKTDEKYKAFKQFDTVDDHSDHYYSKPELRKVQIVKKPQKDWTKRVQREWKILKKDLPDTIFVRAYEERMDLLRAAIMGPAGTPYHDGLFFFDIYFPPQYPNVPPLVNYRAGGLRLNPNLYACGKVCLSLLNTWSGSGCEKWNPSNSTMMQVLVSIQALVLNAKPYFNEPGYAMDANTPHGEKKSLTYNEDTFLLSCRTMLYSLRNPPKNFEDFVAGHFRESGRNILVACRAYLEGAQVGCLVGNGAQDVDEGDKSCSVRFKHSLKRLYEELVIELSGKGADCDEFLSQKAGSESSTAAADTTLRL